MTIFRFRAILVAFLLPCVAQAQTLDLTPRSSLEAVVLGDIEAAQAHLVVLTARAKEEQEAVVSELRAAGFEPDRGTEGCDFYGYHRRTTQEGAARSVQIALCRNGSPMVLVQDILPPNKRGGGMSKLRERNDP